MSFISEGHCPGQATVRLYSPRQSGRGNELLLSDLRGEKNDLLRLPRLEEITV